MEEHGFFQIRSGKIYSHHTQTYINPGEIAIMVNKKEKKLVKIGNFNWILQLYEDFKTKCKAKNLQEESYDVILVSFSPRYDYLSLDEKCTLCNWIKVSPDIMQILCLDQERTLKRIRMQERLQKKG